MPSYLIYSNCRPMFSTAKLDSETTIDQIHRLTKIIEKVFQENKFCPAMFLDVSLAFERIWPKSFIFKMSKLLPADYCHVLVSYLLGRKFRLTYEETCSSFFSVLDGVTQRSVLVFSSTYSSLRRTSAYSVMTPRSYQQMGVRIKQWKNYNISFIKLAVKPWTGKSCSTRIQFMLNIRCATIIEISSHLIGNQMLSLQNTLIFTWTTR